MTLDATPLTYLQVLEHLHQILRPAVYLEIGVATGLSLALSRSATVAIDPYLQPETGALRGKPWLKLYETGSDDFFLRNRPEHVLEGAEVELAFIDGLHRFEQVLRDFVNVERWSAPHGVVAIHDVLSPDPAWARREPQLGAWVGDVWQIVPCLRRHRPDLRLHLLDARPTGLLVVTGLDPANTHLADNLAAVTEEWLGLPEPSEERIGAYMVDERPLAPAPWLESVRRGQSW